MSLQIYQIPALIDNYIYILHAEERTAVIDPSESNSVLSFLQQRDWTLEYILNTHHHFDHVGGNEDIKQHKKCLIYASKFDEDRVPGCDKGFKEGEIITLGHHQIQVIDIPGHTKGHIAYYLPENGVLFCGDTLFAMGCGRVFEGTMEQLYTSLQKIKTLPDDTSVYCAHEYTLKNIEFALTIEPNNKDLQNKLRETKAKREKNQSTVPTFLGDEKKYNPFLKAKSFEEFKEIRLKKDIF
jgi:hydroxyacylglutathione hydrolase